MALEFVFSVLTHGEKVNFHVIFERIDSKSTVNIAGLAVNIEADRLNTSPELQRKSLFDGWAKRAGLRDILA